SGAALAAASTSSLVSRPSLPLPLILLGSTPCSSTRRRTAGDRVVTPSPISSLAVAAGAAAAVSALAAGAAALPLPASIVAITAPTLTVSPTATTCWPITPATGEGTSTATL